MLKAPKHSDSLLTFRILPSFHPTPKGVGFPARKFYNRKRVLAASSQDWQLTPFNRSLRKHASGVYLEADYGTLNPIV